MVEIVRTVRADEWDDFMRFLERCYGHRRNYFAEMYPELYRPDADALPHFLILEDEGRIASHVGLFPLEVACLGVKITVGGIGGVATLPEYRGRGYMSRLLDHAAGLMRRRGWPLSVLWGDRQRYHPFGWETAGLKYSLTVSRRALDRAGVRPCLVEESSPEEALEAVEGLNAALPMRVASRLFPLVLRKPYARIWLGKDGYIISSGNGYDPPNVLEVASEGGREPELVRGVMERCFQGSAMVRVNAFDDGRLTRLLNVTSDWALEPEGQFRIISLEGLIKPFSAFLSKRTGPLRDLQQAIGLRLRDEVDAVTLSVVNSTVKVTGGVQSSNYLELTEHEGVRILLGGPTYSSHRCEFRSLLQLPLHIPELDHV